MESILEEFEYSISEFGRIHWMLEEIGKSTLELVAVLEDFRHTHPVHELHDDNGKKFMSSYHNRQGGWAIERMGWEDPTTGQFIEEHSFLCSVRCTTRKPMATGNLELKLSDSNTEVQSLFVQLVNYLIAQFPHISLRDMLKSRIDNQAPNDPWDYSDITESFSLPETAQWLVNQIQTIGTNIEAAGGITFKHGLGLYYKLRAIPGVEQNGDLTILTWLYARDSIYLTSNPTIPCILWKVTELESSIHISAYCKDQVFSKHFYKMIQLVKKSSGKRKQTAIQDAELNGADTAKQDSPESTLDDNLPVSKGRPVLLCNWWAFTEKLLGRTPDIDDYQHLYSLERSDVLADPKKSMEAGIRGLEKKYKKLTRNSK